MIIVMDITPVPTPAPLGPDDVGTAISQALVQGGSQWLVATIVAFLPVLWTMTLMLHLGRPYIVRTLRRCGLRLGADVWWMSYLLMRDGLMVVTFGLSWVFFLPNIETSMALPLTGSLAAVCLLGTLAVKFTRRVDDDVNAYRLATVLLVLGATLYYVPQVFAVEAASQEHLAQFGTFFTSNSNTNVALVLTWISLAAITLILGWLFIRVTRLTHRTMAPRRLQPVGTSPLSPKASA
jgi:hypothetical protein